jgi:hypothetical protein
MGSAIVARVVVLKSDVARIIAQQNVVGSAVVARAAVEPNWDLHISPARSGKQGPMSRRGTSFGGQLNTDQLFNNRQSGKWLNESSI